MSKNLRKIKIILAGDTGVGKTTILNQYFNNIFSDKTLTTLGSEYKTKEIEIKGEKIKLEIWDTPGQIRLRGITKNFIQNSDIGIMVCDITNKKSFINLKDWYSTFDNVININDIVIGIAANKSDLIEKEQVNFIDINNFANSINSKAFSTSGKDHQCIEDMINILTQDYYDKFLFGNSNTKNNISLDSKKYKELGSKKSKKFNSNKPKSCC